MSRNKATKRRKMWAVVDDEGRGAQVFLSRKRAVAWAAREPRDGTGWHVVPYIERLPGDVVLSREERRTLYQVVRWMDMQPSGNIKVPVGQELYSKLRGRR